MSEERTAPRLLGQLEVVCEGREVWCGQSLPALIEIDAENIGVLADVECQRCGRWYAVDVCVRRGGQG